MTVNLFDLSGRNALVTGGSKGLGQSMARALAQSGANVVIVARHAPELEAALPAILEGTSARAAWLTADLANRDEVENMAARSGEFFGPIDILVNNAGTNRVAHVEEVADADWDHLLAVNLTAPLVLCRALAKSMMERRWGRIIHISSVFGLVSLRRPQFLQRNQGWIDRTDPLDGARAGASRRDRQRHSPRPIRDPNDGGASPRPRQETLVHRPGPHGTVGTPRRAHRASPPPRLRRGQLHHRYDPGRRRRLAGPVRRTAI